MGVTQPFTIGPMDAAITADPAAWRARFAACPALAIEQALAPQLHERLMARAAAVRFVDDDVPGIGLRQVEASPQAVGNAIGLLLGRAGLYRWLEQVADAGPIRGVTGRLVQSCAQDRDALGWHDDGNGDGRKLAVVLNLSADDYDGGVFEIRRVGSDKPFFTYRHAAPGSLVIFAVRPDLEHRVTQITAGGPRRVWAGWFVATPEPRGLPGG